MLEPVLILGILVLALYGLVRLSATAAAQLAGARYKAFRQLAHRYGGKYESRGLTDPPTVSFTHEGSHVRVGMAPNVPGQLPVPRTRVVARFARGLPFRMELVPAGRTRALQPPKGTRRVRSGDAEFDRGFVVQANDPEITGEFLNPSVRWTIENLRRMSPPAGMLVSVNPERILVQVDRNLSLNVEALAYAVRGALELHDYLQASVASRLAEGISIVSFGAAGADEGPPLCKVCGETITDVHVICSVCRAPHHRDCWAFIGGCSIFGCNGKQCIPA